AQQIGRWGMAMPAVRRPRSPAMFLLTADAMLGHDSRTPSFADSDVALLQFLYDARRAVVFAAFCVSAHDVVGQLLVLLFSGGGRSPLPPVVTAAGDCEQLA